MPIRRRAARLALVVGAVAAVLLATAPAASAHALLLRTSPSPQSTVPTSPEQVQLHFSEAVEVTAGDVRVYDVDGKRVDEGKVRRTDANREVDVAVPRLADGTYTVTWRAVSADTHAVRGGFVFYVGHPSSISPVAISGSSGASHAVGFAYGVERFAWFAALSLLIGLVAVRRWCWTPALRRAELGESDAAVRFRRSFSRLLPAAWAVLAFAGVAALFLQTATSRGTAFVDAFSGSAVGSVLDASFGHLWFAQMILTIVLIVPVAGLAGRTRLLGVAPDAWIATGGLVAGGLCVVAGLQGHARTASRPAVAVASIAVHLFTVGVWTGGLGALVVVGVTSWGALTGAHRIGVVADVVRRFSRVAVAAVVVIAVTGTVNAAFGFHAVSDLWRDRYGRVVAAKVVLLVVALALAARHRFVTQRRLAGGAEAGGGEHVEPDGTDVRQRELRRFERLAGAELIALVGAIALAAILVAMVPGRTTALAATGTVNQQRRAGAYTVQLLVDPARTGSNQVHVTFVASTGLAASEVVNADVTVAGPGAQPAPLDAQLIGPGHFVATTTLPVAGRYRITVTSGGASSIFSFTIRKGD